MIFLLARQTDSQWLKHTKLYYDLLQSLALSFLCLTICWAPQCISLLLCLTNYQVNKHIRIDWFLTLKVCIIREVSAPPQFLLDHLNTMFDTLLNFLVFFNKYEQATMLQHEHVWWNLCWGRQRFQLTKNPAVLVDYLFLNQQVALERSIQSSFRDTGAWTEHLTNQHCTAKKPFRLGRLPSLCITPDK